MTLLLVFVKIQSRPIWSILKILIYHDVFIKWYFWVFNGTSEYSDGTSENSDCTYEYWRHFFLRIMKKLKIFKNDQI